MRSLALAVATGALFALGLVISGMTSPARVTGFLDVGRAWDPTLAFVMIGAIAVHAPVVRLAKASRAPRFDTRFHWPPPGGIEPRLIAGAALFGIGWGLSGYCPGPALASLAGAVPQAAVFTGGMIAGIAVIRALGGSRPSEL